MGVALDRSDPQHRARLLMDGWMELGVRGLLSRHRGRILMDGRMELDGWMDGWMDGRTRGASDVM